MICRFYKAPHGQMEMTRFSVGKAHQRSVILLAMVGVAVWNPLFEDRDRFSGLNWYWYGTRSQQRGSG